VTASESDDLDQLRQQLVRFVLEQVAKDRLTPHLRADIDKEMRGLVERLLRETLQAELIEVKRNYEASLRAAGPSEAEQYQQQIQTAITHAADDAAKKVANQVSGDAKVLTTLSESITALDQRMAVAETLIRNTSNWQKDFGPWLTTYLEKQAANSGKAPPPGPVWTPVSSEPVIQGRGAFKEMIANNMALAGAVIMAVVFVGVLVYAYFTGQRSSEPSPADRTSVVSPLPLRPGTDTTPVDTKVAAAARQDTINRGWSQALGLVMPSQSGDVQIVQEYNCGDKTPCDPHALDNNPKQILLLQVIAAATAQDAQCQVAVDPSGELNDIDISQMNNAAHCVSSRSDCKAQECAAPELQDHASAAQKAAWRAKMLDWMLWRLGQLGQQ
jgi:hypothetical protein